MIISLLATTLAMTEPSNLLLEKQVNNLWNSLSNDPQSKPNIDSLNQLFKENAIVVGITYKNGEASFNLMQASKFIASQNRIKPNGFYECEISRELRVSGDFATVLSVVESRRNLEQKKADFTGLNSMQWVNVGNDWKLISLYYYLPYDEKGDLLLSGTPGKCLNQQTR
ncbi:hypothetical protein [Pseudoalteromonas sp. L1]|uniref:hypothetical protein n=1 Tax=Pseudoalteromonas sp. L1 TaxID=195716 RepID=UPI001F3CF373|nr:hypothetical protein [Pseudoalteromonas sp. L1]